MNDLTLYYSACITEPNIFRSASFALNEEQETAWGATVSDFTPRLNMNRGDLIEQLCRATRDLAQLVATAMNIEIEDVFNLVDQKYDSLKTKSGV